MNNFGDDIPEFIYSLPNLKKLILNAIYLSSDFSKLDFGKLACKESLQELWIDYLGDFSNINQNIKLFPNLNEIRISTRGSKVPPTGFINLPNVYFLKIIGYVKDNNRYHATTIFTFDNSVKEKPLDEIERKEAMEKWNEFMSKIEED